MGKATDNVLNFPSLLSCSSYQHFSDNVQTQKRGALAALQLAPSGVHQIMLHHISSFHKHWPKGSGTDMWIRSGKHKHYYKEPFSRQFYLPELLHVLLPMLSLASLTKLLRVDYHACLIRAQTIHSHSRLFSRDYATLIKV